MNEADPPPPGVDALYAAAYADLRRLAHLRLFASGRRDALDTTALVHESYLRLSGRADARFAGKAQFLAYAGKVMRSVIVDLVRARRTERQGGEAVFVTLTTQLGSALARQDGEDEILKVHEALDELQKLDPRMAQVVELRYFAGMTESEVALALGVAERTVRRDWQQARLFLAEALR